MARRSMAMLSLATITCALACGEPVSPETPDAATERPDASDASATMADAGSLPDGGSVPDAGPVDAALEDAAPPVDAGPAELLELGTGTGPAADAPDGSMVELHAGLQGGFHIYISVRARGLALGPGVDPSAIRLEAFDESGTELARVAFTRELTAVADGWYAMTGLPLVLSIASADALVGTVVRVSASLDDATGLTIGCERRWQVVAAASP